MKRFLQKLASSVIRATPSLHPFSESVYPAPLHLSTEHRAAATQFVVSASQTQPIASHVVPPVQTQMPATSQSPSEVQVQSSGTSSVARRDEIPENEQGAYRPLLPRTAEQSSIATGVFAPPKPQVDPQSGGLSSARRHKPEDGQDDTRVSLKSGVDTTRAETGESRPAKIMPLVPHLDAQAFLSARKPAAPPAQFAARVERETRADDIQINIGRIEVIAVPPAAPRATPAPARKGISLDDYLGRRNGRVG